jgi:hypothetical protein
LLESTKDFFTVVVQFLNLEDEAKLVIFPCEDEEAASLFENHHREIIPSDRLIAINIVKSKSYKSN